MRTRNLFFYLCLLIIFVSCSIVRPGEVGVKQKMGKLSDKVKSQGPIWYNPFTTRVIKASVQTTNLELSINLPSKEGLSITSNISILYKAQKNKIPDLIRTFGLEYEDIISNVFRSAAADVCAQYFAKDMHSGMRANIELAILEKMNSTLKKDGIEIESVLMKSIALPQGLASSIEQKLQSEQETLRMEFILQQARLEADRKIIEAKGVRDAQLILSEGLTDQIIKIRSIEAFKELSKTTSSKVIITDGKVPFLINQ